MNTHNEYLQEVESYLVDLEVIQRSKILTDSYQELLGKDLTDLKPALEYANEKRMQNGFIEYKPKKKVSIVGLFFKFSAVMFLLFLGFLSFLVWKFTPIIQVDEESNRVVILGGLIDIDGKAGKLKVGDEYHFSHESFTNDFQASVSLNESQDEVLVNFTSGSFNLKTSEDENFVLDCKLASPPGPDLIAQEDELVKIDFSKIEGLNCALAVPIDKRLTIEGKHGSIMVPAPEYNLYVELENGKVYISPGDEVDYKFSLNIANEDNGFIGDFESSDNDTAYEIRINLDDGAIIKK